MYIHYIALNCAQEKDFTALHLHGLIDFLFLRFHSKTTLILSDKTYTITEPSELLISANTPFKYFSNDVNYHDDYLHFAVENQAQFLAELNFPVNTPIPFSNDTSTGELLTLINKEHLSENKFAASSIDLLVRCLFLKVSEDFFRAQTVNSFVPHYYDLLQVRSKITAAPEQEFHVEELAKLANLSPAYFQVLYKKAFGITCMNEVINARISEAKTLLSSTDLSVAEIAAAAGYHEVFHFIRQFKKSTGLTPGAFRKKTSFS